MSCWMSDCIWSRSVRLTSGICLEYWIKLASGLYAEIQSLPIGENGVLMGLNLGVPGTQNALSGIPFRKDTYKDILSDLRLITI